MFTLAHLSDPHIGPIPTLPLGELVNKRGLGLINWYRKRHRHHRRDVLDAIVADMHAHTPGHVAVTGDLVNISLDAEFAHAARWLEQVGPPHDVTLVPGNHDAYIARAAGHARLHWDEYMKGDDDARRHPEEPSEARPRRATASSFEARGKKPLAPQDDVIFPFIRRRGPIAVIALTTSLPTGPFMATGRLGGVQLARFAEILIALAHEPVFRVVLIHHPPVPNKGHYMKRLIDAPILRALLKEHGAELLLHGHNHEQQLRWLDGPQRIPAVGVPSASAIVSTHDEPAAYNLYRIAGAPGAWQCEMVSRGYRAGHDGIVELQRHTLIG